MFLKSLKSNCIVRVIYSHCVAQVGSEFVASFEDCTAGGVAGSLWVSSAMGPVVSLVGEGVGGGSVGGGSVGGTTQGTTAVAGGSEAACSVATVTLLLSRSWRLAVSLLKDSSGEIVSLEMEVRGLGEEGD